ncbi:MAG: hypothetical protein ACLQRH_01895 [Acidimicrobiales bacterium]
MGESLGLVICEVCGRPCPDVEEQFAVPPELEVQALRAGWRYDERDQWMCRRCLEVP